MKSPGTGLLSGFLSKRTSFIELLLTVLLLAFGINLVSSSIIGLFDLSDRTAFIIGLTFCLIAIMYSVKRFSGERTRRQIVQGFIVHGTTQRAIVSVPEYDFSEKLVSYLSLAFDRDSELKDSWQKNSLHNAKIDDDRISIQIVKEVIEFYVLKLLSDHLKDYFKANSRRENIQEYDREHIQDLLRKNRFLDLFTTSKIYEKYASFVLMLPKGSRISRINHNKIAIDTNKFIIIIDAYFLGVNKTIPQSFHKYCLSLSEGDFEDFSVAVEVTAHFKLGTLFSVSRIQYYQWLDSFLQLLEENISERSFFESIKWNSLRVIIEHLENKLALKKDRTITGQLFLTY